MVKASIIIRTKDEGRTLGGVLEAIKAQTFNDYEVIVVDSGSSDNTLEIARSFDARVITIAMPAFSYGFALNTGLAAANGEFGISLAGHARPANECWLTELLRPFGDNRIAGAVSRQIPYQWFHRSWALTTFDLLYRWTALRGQRVISRLFVNSSSAIRLAVWDRLPFDEQLESCEDQLWGRQVIGMGYHLAYCQKSLLYHSHQFNLAEKISHIKIDMNAMRKVAASK
jgi:rhamnosyltransferase